MSAGPAIIVLGPGGMDTARQVRAAISDSEIHGLARRVPDADVTFDDTGDHLRALFADGTSIVGICAAGILIRLLAPALADKTSEPAVIAVAEDGSAVVPLLGGHHGANDFAADIAAALGVAAAVTTAGDVRFGAALDNPPAGWTLANPDDMKSFAADLLAGEAVRLDDTLPVFIAGTDIPRDLGGSLRISATPYRETGDARHLVYHPASVAIGVGCERGAAPDELADLVETALTNANIARAAIAGVFSLDLKADEPAVHALADALNVPARFFDAATLEAEAPRLQNPSDVVFREVGCHGVSEGAALAAAGPDGQLIAAKTKSDRATCALALAPVPINAADTGLPRGRLLIVGTGPGSDGWMTAESEAAIAAATDLVGYTLYLDILGPRAAGRTRHDFPLGEEIDRVRAALDIAATGKTVALVSSGDPGIYAMATLAFELLETGDRADWRRLAIEVCPGISALQAAAARSGAPLGHDFCTISLSDLLTPWDAIERRVKAAADGDFVIAFYNPVSMRRTWQLAKARDMLLDARPGSTPVILARNLGRDGEQVRTVTLEALDIADVDMLTVVLVGSSETRAVARGDGRHWVYTPRGYAGKNTGKNTDEEESTG
ncbi:MAG: precorrin-3B C(17)-methyltransferase [Alphaproteobacteria bacterium]